MQKNISKNAQKSALKTQSESHEAAAKQPFSHMLLTRGFTLTADYLSYLALSAPGMKHAMTPSSSRP